jgi:outer membrane protein OmpA-like peptidoglycan-associated protein
VAGPGAIGHLGSEGWWLASCGGPPADNPLLETARSEFESAERDEDIVRYAPVELKVAEEELMKGIALWEAKADKVYIDHHAYLAKQRTAIARETAKLNAAQNAIERAGSERQQVLIDVRRMEADLALDEARRERQSAEEARSRAEEARNRAEELARRVNELEAERTERGLVLTLGDVLFDFNDTTLKPGGRRAVNELARFMQEYQERNVLIEGYTDSIGSDEYNLQLSERRAASVREALLEHGISRDRIRITGYGKQYPVASNASESGRQQNRRVEVVISDSEGVIQERGN